MLPSEGTILGKLEYLEIYDYYDIPILFSCKNERGEVYLAICVDKINSGHVFLFALVEDTSTLSLLEGKKFVNPADFYLYQNLKIYEVIIQTSIVNEVDKKDVEYYFSDYIEDVKRDQKLFAEMLQEIDKRLENNK